MKESEVRVVRLSRIAIKQLISEAVMEYGYEFFDIDDAEECSYGFLFDAEMNDVKIYAMMNNERISVKEFVKKENKVEKVVSDLNIEKIDSLIDNKGAYFTIEI